jgi:DNA-binding response OmpR family regulator
VDGPGVCRVLRGEGDRTPELMITARQETADRVAGLDAQSKNLAAYIGYLRRTLTTAGAPSLIPTVGGVGYTVRRP